ncbi:MAG TPA: AMP-binding protein [Iamia sp.]|jgi:acyl-CoA synthetase (AMP-forming)/AMP-acid ligase II|nr:AMP-binding protein [Iamia sp.]
MDRVPASVARVLDRALARDPGHEALVTRDRRLTYAELDALAHRAAHALRDLGVGPGDRVAASLPNEADVVVAFHGAMRLGAVWVGVNRALAPPEKRYLLDDCGATLLLSDDDAGDLGVRRIDLATWRAAVDTAPAEPVGIDVDPRAPAGIAYTSGTTGHPKGAVHSQSNLLAPGAALVESRGYGPDLRKGDCFPFTILNLAVLTTLLVSQAGGTSIVMDRTDAEGVAEWVRTERITTWNGAPAMLHSLATNESVAPSDLASLDEVWTGGGDCPEAIRTAFETKFGRPVLATYGLSEAPTVVAIDPRTGRHVAGASGRPLPHLAVRIAGTGGETRPAGETGEIRVGPADDRYRLMLGYWERPEATAATLADGELHTGDLGFLDDDGYLHVRDRTSLLIIRGGANVYPAEVERVLLAHPGIIGAAVLGVPDERLGERVVAVVEPVPGEEIDLDVLRSHCRANLARYKVPERFVVVAGLPRNAMGKVVRTRLPDLL